MNKYKENIMNGRTAAGSLLKYMIGDLDSRPTGSTSAHYTVLPEVKVIPQIGNEVNVAQTTPLSATHNHTYTKLLDTMGGGNWAITANDCIAFRNAYNAMMDEYEGRADKTDVLWLEVYIPDNEYTLMGGSSATQNSYFLPVEPVRLGLGELGVDTVMELAANFIPVGQWEEAESSI